jgi:hypothetical protein
MPGFQADRRKTTPLELDLQPGRQRSGLMTNAAQLRRELLQRFEDRIRIGRHRGFEHDFPFLVDHTERSLFHRNVKSGEVFHGCPPLALGARKRPRISTVILGDSRPPRSQSRILRRKPNYADNRSVGGLRPAKPALSFAKLRSDKNQVPTCRQHIPCSFVAVVMPTPWCTNVRHVLPGRRKLGRGSCGGLYPLFAERTQEDGFISAE